MKELRFGGGRGDCPEKYAWMSNFSPHPITWEWAGKTLSAPTTEHAFVWAKFHRTDLAYATKCLTATTPGRSKRMGRTREVQLDPRWELPGKTGRLFKVEMMAGILRKKLEQHPKLINELLETKTARLVEFAPWGDTFWGVNKQGVGKNWLGRLWGELREDVKKDPRWLTLQIPF